MWATGQKTIDERISQGPSSAVDVPGENLDTVLELAQDRGMRVGDVSTAEITDATPAVLASHISQRGCQGPATMGACPDETKGAGGLGSIAEQEVDHQVDVLLGGGRGRFEQAIGSGPDAGKTVVESAQDKGYRYVTDANGLDSLAVNRRPRARALQRGQHGARVVRPAGLARPRARLRSRARSISGLRTSPASRR
jgi:alkaline phosphatase/streptomycin-6-phosphatase